MVAQVSLKECFRLKVVEGKTRALCWEKADPRRIFLRTPQIVIPQRDGKEEETGRAVGEEKGDGCR